MTTLITGVSTRAIAESALRSGEDVITLDYFGDSDQKEIIRNYSLLRDFHLLFRAENLIQGSDNLDFDFLHIKQTPMQTQSKKHRILSLKYHG